MPHRTTPDDVTPEINGLNGSTDRLGLGLDTETSMAVHKDDEEPSPRSLPIDHSSRRDNSENQPVSSGDETARSSSLMRDPAFSEYTNDAMDIKKDVKETHRVTAASLSGYEKIKDKDVKN
jgi:hypothetical protein